MCKKYKRLEPLTDKRVTKIIIRKDEKTKSIILEHTDPIKLSEFLRDKFSSTTTKIALNVAMSDSPLLHVEKCQISVSDKVNTKSFTCYYADVDTASELVDSFINESN